MTTSAKSLCALFLASSFVVLACTSEPAVPAPVADVPVEPEAVATQAADVTPEPGAPMIASDEAIYDFGEIKPVDSIEHTFKIKNIGTADLHIDHVQKT
jgi:hypothetical protein